MLETIRYRRIAGASLLGGVSLLFSSLPESLLAQSVTADKPVLSLERAESSLQLSLQNTRSSKAIQIESSRDLRDWVTIEASYVENDNPAPKATETDQEAEYFRASALPEGHKTDLKVHQFKWQQLGWMDYRLRIDVTAFLPPDLTQAIVTVEGGLVSNVKMTRTDDALAATHFAYKESVDGLFRRLNQSLEREPHRYTAEFHPTLFYPTQAYIDFDERIADEETGFQVSMLGPTSVVDSLDTLPPSDAVEIVKSSVSDNELSLDLRYGGGCAAHFFALVKAGHSTEGRLQLRLIHDANDDRCRAFVFETRAFDLTPILASPQGDELSFEIISGHPSNEKTHLVTLTP